jgi:hypothetical protein
VPWRHPFRDGEWRPRNRSYRFRQDPGAASEVDKVQVRFPHHHRSSKAGFPPQALTIFQTPQALASICPHPPVLQVFIDQATRHVKMKQGVMGIRLKIMLPHDPEGKNGPKTRFPDKVCSLSTTESHSLFPSSERKHFSSISLTSPIPLFMLECGA